jgi:hypothetical protein
MQKSGGFVHHRLLFLARQVGQEVCALAQMLDSRYNFSARMLMYVDVNLM